MNIPPCWIVEHCEIDGMRFRLHGSSAHSMEEARARLAERRDLLQRFLGGHGVTPAEYRAQLANLAEQEKGEDYAVEIFENTLDTLSAQNIVTRNRYGAEVLNSTELCFVDIDHYPGSLWQRLAALIGLAPHTEEARLLAELRHLHAEAPDLAMRLYRTAGGWRLMAEGDDLAPDSPRMHTLFRRLNADPAYVNLCARQQCWRARLTPKPGRLSSRPGRYPRPNAADTPAKGEAEWLERYTAGCNGLAVCRLIESFGPAIRHPLAAWHDERTAALKDALPLA